MRLGQAVTASIDVTWGRMREKNPKKERHNQKQSTERLGPGARYARPWTNIVWTCSLRRGWARIWGDWRSATYNDKHTLLTTGYLQYSSTGSLACSARPCRNYRTKRYNTENEPEQEIRNLYQKRSRIVSNPDLGRFVLKRFIWLIGPSSTQKTYSIQFSSFESRFCTGPAGMQKISQKCQQFFIMMIESVLFSLVAFPTRD